MRANEDVVGGNPRSTASPRIPDTPSFQKAFRITRESGSNFVAAFRLLPVPQRDAMTVLYAFTRRTDDMADGEPEGVTPSTEERKTLLARWRTEVARLESPLSKSPSPPEPIPSNSPPSSTDSPIDSVFTESVKIVPALRETLRRYPIGVESLLAVIDGVVSDLSGPVRLETEEEALLYCDRVAGAVGKGVLAILGTKVPLTDPQLQKWGIACGRALQWTNFLRDLREDVKDRGRVYFPMSDFRETGLSPRDLLALTDRGKEGRPVLRFRLQDPHDPLTLFLTRQLTRTESFYAESEPLADHLEEEGKKVYHVMRGIYHAIFRKIQKRPEIIFERRIRVPFPQKTILLLRALFR